MHAQYDTVPYAASRFLPHRLRTVAVLCMLPNAGWDHPCTASSTSIHGGHSGAAAGRRTLQELYMLLADNAHCWHAFPCLGLIMTSFGWFCSD